jgi:hypothetical protein
MPPLMQPLQEETCPVLPSIADSFLWDDGSEVSPSQIAAIQQQLAEAQCKPLQPMQHKELILTLVCFDPSSVFVLQAVASTYDTVFWFRIRGLE